jgi:hypothetical protein
MALAMAGPALVLAGCGGDNATAPNTETVLEAVSPAAAATGVDPSAPITARFSGPMATGMEQYLDLHQAASAGRGPDGALTADRYADLHP